MASVWGKYPVCVLALGISVLLSGCGSEAESHAQSYAATVANVETITVTSSLVTLHDERQGRVRPLRTAAIRPQVSGIITERLFRQGDTLEKGDALFQIEREAYDIDAEMKQAELRQSIANRNLLQSQYNRLSRLDRANAVSKQAFEEAGFNLQIAKETVETNQARLKHSQLQLDYTRVSAPIDGIIGEALVTEGTLVSNADPTPLAVIQQIDQVYIDVRLPAVNLNQLRALMGSQGTAGLEVSIYSSVHGGDAIKGRILFSGISVDEATGDLSVRILAENPEQVLLPGMYVRTRTPRQQLQAIRVPEQAVQRSSAGDTSVFVVENGQYERRSVVVEGISNNEYILSSGLKENDVVIVKGQENLRDNAQLNISEWQNLAMAH